MPTDLLTSDDLDDLGHESFRVDDPGEIVAKIVAAVDGQRLASPDDAVYALSLALGSRSGPVTWRERLGWPGGPRRWRRRWVLVSGMPVPVRAVAAPVRA